MKPKAKLPRPCCELCRASGVSLVRVEGGGLRCKRCRNKKVEPVKVAPMELALNGVVKSDGTLHVHSFDFVRKRA